MYVNSAIQILFFTLFVCTEWGHTYEATRQNERDREKHKKEILNYKYQYALLVDQRSQRVVDTNSPVQIAHIKLMAPGMNNTGQIFKNMSHISVEHPIIRTYSLLAFLLDGMDTERRARRRMTGKTGRDSCMRITLDGKRHNEVVNLGV